MGIEMVKLRGDLQFASFAPDHLSPNDRDLLKATRLAEVALPEVPDRMEIKLLPSRAVRFARKESGGIVSFMPTYTRELREWAPDVIIENAFSWLTPRSYQTYSVAKRLGIPVVYYDPGDVIPIGSKHRVMALWESSVFSDIAGIITFNAGGARRFVDKYDYPPQRIHVIPKPVDVGRFRNTEDRREQGRLRLGLKDNHVAVGYLGRLARYKGSASLLEAARVAMNDHGLSDLRFVFVGGTLTSTEAGKDYELPNTQVTGMIPNSDIPEVLAALDIVVFPDLTNPGAFPTAVAETMAAGKAIIAGLGSNTKLVPLRHGETALFVPPSSPEAILDQLRVLVEDPDRVGRLGKAVGDFAAANMDYPVVAARWLEVIDRACSLRQIKDR
ncbi:MAG: hypothetical protein A2133_07210 [Actinobacteria bacterium RBG_16_64_13]|nr:MAG: hypothetical protein A2133_07210 [Actinobacteria bacterium RBG_16_64_13]